MRETDNKWMRYIGRHEGGHLDGIEALPDIIQEELKADKIALEAAVKEGDTEFMSSWRAFRALRTQDDTHATQESLLSGDPASKLHQHVADNLESIIYDTVHKHFDYEEYNDENVSNSKELLNKDPDAFFTALNKGVNEKINDIVDDYNEAPDSYKARENIITVQIAANYTIAFESAYRRYALGQETPEATAQQLLPEGLEKIVYQDTEINSTIQKLVGDSLSSAIKNEAPENIVNWKNYANYGDSTEIKVSPRLKR